MPTFVAHAYQASGTAISVAINSGSAANRYCIVWQLMGDGSWPSDLSVDGGTMTVAPNTSQGGFNVPGKGTLMCRMLYKALTGTGTVTVTGTNGGGLGIWTVVEVWSDVAGIGDSDSSQATSAGPSLTLTTANGDSVIMMLDDGVGNRCTPSSPATAGTNNSTDLGVFYSGFCNLRETATGASTTIDGTWTSGSQPWMGSAIVLQGSGGGGGGSSGLPINAISQSQSIAFGSARFRAA